MNAETSQFLSAMRKRGCDPSLSDIEALLKMVRDGDLIHVDEVQQIAQQDTGARAPRPSVAIMEKG